MKHFATYRVDHKYRDCRAHFVESFRNDLELVGKFLSSPTSSSVSKQARARKLVRKWARKCVTRCEQFHLLKAMIETVPFVRLHTNVEFASQFLFEPGQTMADVDKRYLHVAAVDMVVTDASSDRVCKHCDACHDKASYVSAEVVSLLQKELVDGIVNNTVTAHLYQLIS